MAMSIHSGRLLVTLSVLALCIASRPARAATETASFGVNVTVLASCQVSYGSDRAPSTVSISPVSVTCSHPVSYHVTVGVDQSIRPTLPGVATQETGPAVARFAAVPGFASSFKWGHAGTHLVARADNRSVQALTLGGGSMESRHPPSVANPESIVITVIY